ncbi:MAG: hypothetical protein ACFFG0_11590, partial [Candidatus Thorarchaeota archaeon]
MKYSIYVQYTLGTMPQIRIIELECKGTGTEENPIIIEPSDKIPQGFFLKDSNLHILIRNFNSNKYGISIIYCKNVNFEDCLLSSCILNNSSHINIRNVSTDYLKISYCSYTDVKESVFKRVKIRNSTLNISFLNCTINRIRKSHTRGINFENTKILKIYTYKSIKYIFSDYKPAIFIIIIVAGSALIFFLVFFYLILPMGTIGNIIPI